MQYDDKRQRQILGLGLCSVRHSPPSSRHWLHFDWDHVIHVCMHAENLTRDVYESSSPHSHIHKHKTQMQWQTISDCVLMWAVHFPQHGNMQTLLLHYCVSCSGFGHRHCACSLLTSRNNWINDPWIPNILQYNSFSVLLWHNQRPCLGDNVAAAEYSTVCVVENGGRLKGGDIQAETHTSHSHSDEIGVSYDASHYNTLHWADWVSMTSDRV